MIAVPGELHELVERFDRERAAYRSGRYSEAQGRVGFINPLFALLGWDVENRRGRPEAYREVVFCESAPTGAVGKELAGFAGLSKRTNRAR